MITIEQLLESVDLDLEPRWVTKDEDGSIWIWNIKPDRHENWHLKQCVAGVFYGRFISERLKLSEFAGKPWQKCIYEVPRKTDEQNLEKLRPADSDLVYRVNLPRKTTGNIERLNLLNDSALLWGKKINELVAAVNELKGV